ncbi:ABC transporter permease [Neorhodopirellula pilleata]|uniref:Transport permease protein n=1 Tax=Neorhodopirellula pilleata TaxID=2714738 RepID=A0A5C6AA27_9BACT|nr:ABC transporter permease [Neorhodopirellula pilleata]TWT96260.1 Teichoic acid translocation permease protein TagG [Neorhodopirellula pilleata]
MQSGKNLPATVITIEPPSGWFSLNLRDIWRYRDLLLLLVYRDFVSLYKQTILGPIWFLIQPIMTTLVFTLVFKNIAGISTDGLPGILFYLAGITCWSYFSESLTKTSETFTANANVFGKVYFPRIIVPLSIVASGLLKFAVQFILFIAVLFYYKLVGEKIQMNTTVFLFPLLVLLMAMIGLGAGMIISSMTTKYRDLRFLLQFAIQLAMYGTPVIYPASTLPEKYQWIINANPLTPILETFRHAFLGVGQYSPLHLAYSTGFATTILLVGTVIFNRVEKTFMDTV